MKTNNRLLKKLLNTKKIHTIFLTNKYYSPFINSDRLDAVFIFDAHSRKLIEANPAFYEIFQYTPNDLANLYLEDIVIDNLPFLTTNINNILKFSFIDLPVQLYRRKNSSILYAESKVKLFKCRKKQFIIVSIRDITDWQHQQNRLQLALQVFNSALDGILVTDTQGVIQLVNPAFLKNTGYALDELLGMTPRILKSGKHDDSFYAELWHSLFEREQWQGEIWNKRKNGELYPLWLMINAVKDEHGKVVMYSAMAHDLSDRLKYEEKIKYQAFYDGLTDLPNRRFFYQKAHDCILLAKRYNYLMAIMFIDLDAFKIINDNFGHSIGDLLLIEVGQRLRKCVRESDTVARIGGDEFTLILSKINDKTDAELIALKIHHTLSQPFTMLEQEITISCSIGITIFPEHGDNEEELVKKADNAMYNAKSEGKNSYRFYSEDIQTKKTYTPV